MYCYNWLFSRQNKKFLGKSSNKLLFTAKILHEAMYLLPLPGPNHLQNLTPKCEILRAGLHCAEKWSAYERNLSLF